LIHGKMNVIAMSRAERDVVSQQSLHVSFAGPPGPRLPARDLGQRTFNVFSPVFLESHSFEARPWCKICFFVSMALLPFDLYTILVSIAVPSLANFRGRVKLDSQERYEIPPRTGISY
jgi:hypothetical protein